MAEDDAGEAWERRDALMGLVFVVVGVLVLVLMVASLASDAGGGWSPIVYVMGFAVGLLLCGLGGNAIVRGLRAGRASRDE